MVCPALLKFLELKVISGLGQDWYLLASSLEGECDKLSITISRHTSPGMIIMSICRDTLESDSESRRRNTK